MKFKDADLVGFSIRVSIGEKPLAKGEVEIKPRGGLGIFCHSIALDKP
jgi:prolyl-tRNA synthetase